MSADRHQRLFVAIPVPETVKPALSALGQQFKSAAPVRGMRWVPSYQWHLTLRFLGDVQVDQISLLAAAVTKACHGFHPFSLELSPAGFFPNAQRPKVLWAGVHCGTNCLMKLQASVSKASDPFASQPAEHSYSAHLTLARIPFIDQRDAARLADAVRQTPHPKAEWTVDRVEIIRSILSPQGSQYTPVESIRL